MTRRSLPISALSPGTAPVRLRRHGGCAVLKGRDPDRGRDVAIKVLWADLRDKGDLVRRFVEEAQIGGRLQHLGVVPIYELGTFADRRPFFSMKLVKGQTVADLLAARSGPADDLPRLLSIFAAIAGPRLSRPVTAGGSCPTLKKAEHPEI
jgi:serine/threonine-protein kinase